MNKTFHILIKGDIRTVIDPFYAFGAVCLSLSVLYALWFVTTIVHTTIVRYSMTKWLEHDDDDECLYKIVNNAWRSNFVSADETVISISDFSLIIDKLGDVSGRGYDSSGMFLLTGKRVGNRVSIMMEHGDVQVDIALRITSPDTMTGAWVAGWSCSGQVTFYRYINVV